MRGDNAYLLANHKVVARVVDVIVQLHKLRGGDVPRVGEITTGGRRGRNVVRASGCEGFILYHPLDDRGCEEGWTYTHNLSILRRR